MTKKDKREIKEYLKENLLNHEDTLAKKKEAQVELLNRDYYRGRFASINSKGEYIFNGKIKKSFNF